MAIDEAELEPDEFAQKISSQQILQNQVKNMHSSVFIIEPLKDILSFTVIHIAATWNVKAYKELQLWGAICYSRHCMLSLSLSLSLLWISAVM